MNNRRTMVAPSILSADFGRMSEEIARMEECGADLIHCDVMDGIFVPNITFGFKMISDIKKKSKVPLDVHLMIDKPERYIERFIDAGADWLTFHTEASEKTIPTLELIKKSGVKCGAVIKPDTSVDVLKECFPICDLVLLMSVYPGFGGQKFIPQSLERMARLKEMRDKINPNALLEIDGGVNEHNASDIVRAGCDVLVAGSTLFSAKNPAAVIEAFHLL